MTIKFYSKLDIAFYVTVAVKKDELDESVYDNNGFLDETELVLYEEDINKAIKKSYFVKDESAGLMNYFNLENDGMKKRIKEKVKSAFPKVEVINKRLFGVMECETDAELNEDEIDILKDYFEGQYRAVWGLMFAYNEIKTNDGTLYVSFLPGDFQIKTESEFYNSIANDIIEDESDLNFKM